MSEPIVKVIKANPLGVKSIPNVEHARLKVAAYARVSTDSNEQEDSFDRQVDYYTRYIAANPNWEFVKVYSDPGISGTRADKRPGFQEMISDCKLGKINRILVKSLARFARNTVDCLNYIRELKEIGVSIYFEAQNIDTMTPGGDILITILAATAEEESRTISKNVRWAYQKKFQKGDFTFDYKHFFGLTRDENRKVVIVEEQAKVVRRIYREYLYGHSISMIANALTNEQILTPWGNKIWRYGNIKSILTNEKYYGAVKMGKTYKPDVLSKKRYKNEGQVESYYVENIIPPIIDKKTFDMVQTEIKSRELAKKTQKDYIRNTAKMPFSHKLVCGHCGAYFVKSNNLRMNYERINCWSCHNRAKDRTCRQRTIAEYKIEDAFVVVLKEVIKHAGDIKKILKESIKNVVVDPSDVVYRLDDKISKLQDQVMELHRQRKENLITEAEYTIKGGKISSQIDDLRKERDSLKENYDKANLDVLRAEEINKALSEISEIDSFDGDIFRCLVEYVTINDKKLIFHFKFGLERSYELE